MKAVGAASSEFGLPKDSVAGDLSRPMVLARCDKKTVTAMVGQVSKKPGPVSRALRKALPQIEQFISR
jgi:hypothetical protein